MSIRDEFTGLNVKDVIGGPLSAAANASSQLAKVAAEFIENVEFDKEGKRNTAFFSCQKHSVNDNGSNSHDEMKIVDDEE